MQLVTVSNENHDVLRGIAEEVPFPLSNQHQQHIADMKVLVGQLSNPVGLAAPQVGIPLQIMMIEIPEEMVLTTFINPSYTPIPEKGMEKVWEGCFSVPDMMGDVYRYKRILGRWMHSINFGNQKAEASLACKALNIMTRLGMPITERIN